MDSVKTLIDEWSETRSQRALAKVLGASEQRLSQWKTGIRPMPDATFALLAEVVRGEAEAKELTWAYVRRHVPMMERIREGFNRLLSLAKPRKARFYGA